MRSKWPWLIGLAALLLVGGGSPYVGWLANRVIGTNTVVYVEYDGRSRTMILGPSTPLPEWLPRMPWSLTVNAAQWPLEPDTGSQDVLVHAGLDETIRFYRETFAREGFDVDEPSARAEDGVLGVAGTLLARRDATQVRVLVRSRESLLNPARVVQVNWYPKR